MLARMWAAALAGPAEHGPGALRWLEARVDAPAAAHNLTQVAVQQGEDHNVTLKPHGLPCVRLCSLVAACQGLTLRCGRPHSVRAIVICTSQCITPQRLCINLKCCKRHVVE